MLSGCATHRIVDSQVSAFSQFQTAPVAGAAWAFERLPSQQQLEGAAASRQSKLEAMAAQALAQIGLASEPVNGHSASGKAMYTVQMNARIQRLDHGPWDHEPTFGLGFGWGFPGRDGVFSVSGRVPLTQPWYVREISLIIRDAQDKRVVYETQARHEGRWADDEAVLPAMLAAALQGFPKPPDGTRMITIEIPR
jgi:hypothetical protein